MLTLAFEQIIYDIATTITQMPYDKNPTKETKTYKREFVEGLLKDDVYL